MPPIVLALIPHIPELVALGKAAFAKANPGAPEPTSEEVIAAWIQASASSLAKDALWLASHPAE